MAEQGKEQLVIEAVLKDMVTAQAGKIIESLKKFQKESQTPPGGGSPDKGPEGVAKSLTKLLPIARRAGGELVAMSGQLGKFGSVAVGSLREAAASFAQLEAGAGAAGGALLAAGAALASVAVVGTGLVAATHQAFAFDEAMKIVHISANLTKGEMAALEETVKKFQARGASAAEAANAIAAAFRFLTKDTADAQAAAGSVLMASRVDVGGGNSADLMKGLSDTVKAFGMNASDTDRVLGILYATSLKTGSGMGEVASVLAQIAPSASVAKVSLEDVAATLAVSSDKAGGLSEAAGALGQFLSQISKPTSKLASDLRSFNVDTAAGADGMRDLHGILAQIGDLSKQDGGIIETLAGSSRQGNKIFVSAADDAAAYYDALRAMRTGAIELAKKEVALSKEDSEVLSRAAGNLAVFGSTAGGPFKTALVEVVKFLDGFGGASHRIEEVTQKTESLAEAVTEVARAAKVVDLDSPLKRQIEELSARIGPLVLKTQLDPATLKTVSQDLVTLQAALSNKAALKAGQLDAGSAQALARIAQLTSAIEQAQAFSADMAAKTATGYEKQRLELEAADQALARSISRLTLAGIKGGELLAQARAVTAEMRRAADAQSEIQSLSLKSQLLNAQRQQLQGEMEIAKALGDVARAGELVLQIDELDGRIIAANAARSSAAIAEQYRGRSDLLELAQKMAEAEQAAADAQRDAAFFASQRADADHRGDLAREIAEMAKASSDYTEDQVRATGVLRQLERDRLELATRMLPHQEQILEYYDKQTELLKQQFEISGSFKRGMDEILRTYSDTAKQLYQAGQSFITSFHDEGAGALSDLLKGNLSGGDALKQFGKGVLGNVIDSGSSLLMDQVTTGIFGTGKRPETSADKMLTAAEMFANSVTLFAQSMGGQYGPPFMAGPFTPPESELFKQAAIAVPGITPGAQGPVTEALMMAGQDIQAAGATAAGGVQGAGGLLSGVLQGLAGNIGGVIQSLMGLLGGGGGMGPGFIGPILQAQGGVWGGTLLPLHAAGGGVFGRRTLLEVAEIAGRQEAVVPMHGGGIMADMTSRGPRVRVAGADIPLGFRGGGREGPTITVNPTANVTLVVHALEPRGAENAVMAQMPKIQKAIAQALVQGSDRQLRDAVQGAAR